MKARPAVEGVWWVAGRDSRFSALQVRFNVSLRETRFFFHLEHLGKG